MTSIRLAWAAALAAALALFPLPWYAGRTEALLLLLPDRAWLWPGSACLGAAAVTALAVPRAGRGLVALAAAALVLLLLQGIAIGLPTTTWPITEALFGASVRQPAFGPGAAVALAAAALLMALGFPRARAFNTDTTVALIAVAGGVSLALFVFLPLLRVLLCSSRQGGSRSPSRLTGLPRRRRGGSPPSRAACAAGWCGTRFCSPR